METLMMSGKERRRMVVLSKVRDGQITLREASGTLGLSYRQTLRVNRRFRDQKDAGLVHRLRGKASNRAKAPTDREVVLTLCRDKYEGFGPTLACEYLEHEEGWKVDAETLRRWLLAAGLWRKRRKRSGHRRWRPRRSCRGELVQMDGSHHDWFEGRGPWCVLMVMIDDATGLTSARFFESETTSAAFEMMERYIARHGRPLGLYVDKDSIYKVNRDATVDENLANTGPLTQFARAMKQLDIELICAHSPQAKGRVERMNGTLQDRLVKAMRLKGLCDIASANAYLEGQFLGELNAKFTVRASKPADMHRALDRGTHLPDVLCFEEKRVVNYDWTVSWKNRWFQVQACEQSLGLAKQPVVVRERLDGSIALLLKGRALKWKELPSRPARRKATAPIRIPGGTKATVKAPVKKPRKPGPDHPWRGGGGGGSDSRSRLGPGSAPDCSPTAHSPALRRTPTARTTPL